MMKRLLAVLLQRPDDLIATLIRPPRVLHAGDGWADTRRLIPTGAADREALLAAQLHQSRRPE